MRSFTLLFASLCCWFSALMSTRPNIIYLLADDLGWNDLSINGGSQTKTPNIDRLMTDGLRLNRFYVNYRCSPTRSSILTGKYPFELGFQGGAIRPDFATGLSLEVETLSEILQRNNYQTYTLGKWHLGYFNEEYTPLNRGFDFFYGSYTGSGDRFTLERCEERCGIDFRDQNEPVGEDNTEYIAYLFRDYILNVFNELSTQTSNSDSDSSSDSDSDENNDPFFILYSFQIPHSPIQAPLDKIEMANDTDVYAGSTNRVTYNAMVMILDDIIGQVEAALKENNLWDNTIIFFSSDNGGANNGRNGRGSNYPLRGRKATPWEGGVRVPAFFNGGWLNNDLRGTEYNNLMCANDVFKTFLSFANIDEDEYNVEQAESSIDLSQSLLDSSSSSSSSSSSGDDNEPAIRDELVVFLADTGLCESFIGTEPLCGSLIYQNWKYLIGHEYVKESNDAQWFKLPTSDLGIYDDTYFFKL